MSATKVTPETATILEIGSAARLDLEVTDDARLSGALREDIHPREIRGESLPLPLLLLTRCAEENINTEQ